jgi:ribosome-binding factor A
MNQRVGKVESVIREAVAMELGERLESDRAKVTVTGVDAAPDLRNATVWIGLLGTAAEQDALWKAVEAQRGGMQAALAQRMTTKFVPRLELKRDTGGEYAQRMDELLRGN